MPIKTSPPASGGFRWRGCQTMNYQSPWGKNGAQTGGQYSGGYGRPYNSAYAGAFGAGGPLGGQQNPYSNLTNQMQGGGAYGSYGGYKAPQWWGKQGQGTINKLNSWLDLKQGPQMQAAQDLVGRMAGASAANLRGGMDLSQGVDPTSSGMLDAIKQITGMVGGELDKGYGHLKDINRWNYGLAKDVNAERLQAAQLAAGWDERLRNQMLGQWNMQAQYDDRRADDLWTDKLRQRQEQAALRNEQEMNDTLTRLQQSRDPYYGPSLSQQFGIRQQFQKGNPWA